MTTVPVEDMFLSSDDEVPLTLSLSFSLLLSSSTMLIDDPPSSVAASVCEDLVLAAAKVSPPCATNYTFSSLPIIHHHY